MLLTAAACPIDRSFAGGRADMPTAAFDPEYPRALWVWKIDPVRNLTARRKLFELCRVSAITSLYIYMPGNPKATPRAEKALAQFLRQAHEKGLRVEALNGEAGWAFKDGHGACLEWIRPFLEFNSSRPREEQLDGISLDVEPHVTEQWRRYKEKCCDEYLLLFNKAKRLIDEYKQDVKLGAAIATFYSDIDGGEFERELLKYVDYIAVMDYYESASRIIAEAEPHLEMAGDANKQVVIAVETQDLIRLKQGSRQLTFFEEGWEEMENTLGKVKEKLRVYPAFEGFAIHCYYSYASLQKGRNAPKQQRPKKVYTIKSPKRLQDIEIDGNLEDWDFSTPYVIDKKDNVTHGKSAWGGAEDLSIRFKSSWDEEAFYFAFYVADDKIIQGKYGKDMWAIDHVGLWLDIDLMGDYNEAINSNDDFQLGFSPGNFSGILPDIHIWVPDVSVDYKTLIETASMETQHGYIIEVKLPIALFEGISGLKKGERFGISIEPSDTDETAKPQKSLMSLSINREWGNPVLFGILELQ